MDGSGPHGLEWTAGTAGAVHPVHHVHFVHSASTRAPAVLKFVGQNPGTDAEIVAVRVGLPKGQAQGLLDDLVIRGRLRMKSGQHGRCYVVLDEC